MNSVVYSVLCTFTMTELCTLSNFAPAFAIFELTNFLFFTTTNHHKIIALLNLATLNSTSLDYTRLHYTTLPAIKPPCSLLCCHMTKVHRVLVSPLSPSFTNLS